MDTVSANTRRTPGAVTGSSRPQLSCDRLRGS